MKLSEILETYELEGLNFKRKAFNVVLHINENDQLETQSGEEYSLDIVDLTADDWEVVEEEDDVDLQAEITLLQEKIEELDDAAVDHNNQIDQLESQVNDLENTVEELESTIARMDDDLSQLAMAIKDLFVPEPKAPKLSKKKK